MTKNYVFNQENYKFGMDWLNGVLPLCDVFEVFQEFAKFSSKLRFERWVLMPSGKYNYSRCYALDGQSSFLLAYIPVSDEEAFSACSSEQSNNPYIFISISGDGIRKLSAMGSDSDNSALHKLLFFLYRNNFKASRFDTYCDILDKKNPVVPEIVKSFNYFRFPQVGKPTLRTKVQRKPDNIKIYKQHDKNGKVYHNVVLGNHGTRFGMFRCYNKLEELVNGRLSDFSSDILSSYNVSDYWYRLEYEIHKENADSCFKSLMQRADEEGTLYFADIFYSALNRVFQVVIPPSLHSNVSDYPLSTGWRLFFDFVSSNNVHLVQFNPVPYIPMSLKRLIKNTQRLASYIYAIDLVRQHFPDLDFYIKNYGRERFDCLPRYRELINELSEVL